MDITWIIISLLFLCLIIILTVSNKPTQLKKHPLKMNSDFSFHDNKKEVISIRLFLENEKTNLDFLINEFKNNNIHLNKKGVFEKINFNINLSVYFICKPKHDTQCFFTIYRV